MHRSRRSASIAALAVCSALASVSAHAQDARPVSVGIALGGAASQGSSVGTHGLALIALASPWQPVAFRFESSFTRWPGSLTSPRLTSVTGNATYSFGSARFTPYVIGGLGTYLQPGTRAAFGVNGGGGLQASFGSFKPFAELRVHTWPVSGTGGTWRRVVPLTLGVMF